MITTHRSSRHSGLVFAAVVVLAGMLATPTPGHAAPPHNGSYVFSGDPAEEKRRLAAIDDVADELFFAVRGMARRRLKEKTEIVPTLTLLRRGDRLRVGYEDRFYSVKIGASPVEVARSGSKLTVMARERAEALIVEFRTTRGRRIETFTRDRAGNLIVDVYVSGKRMPKPLRYRLTYHPM